MKIVSIIKKHIWLFLISLFLILAIAAIVALNCFKTIPLQEEQRIYIPQDASYNDVVDTLVCHNCIDNEITFNSIANLRKYTKCVKSGSYLIQPGTSYLELVHKLRAGNQDPIRITINKHRTVDQLCSFLSQKIELTYEELPSALTNDSICSQLGYTPQTIICLFPRNTYELYWDITIDELLSRFEKESDRFWTPLRTAAAEEMNLSRQEIITLASIIDEETNKNDEKELYDMLGNDKDRKDFALQFKEEKSNFYYFYQYYRCVTLKLDSESLLKIDIMQIKIISIITYFLSLMHFR